jgi:hypothetical protein
VSDYYTNVPVRRLGSFDFPALFLGDHGFNEKFGSALTDAEVRSRMELVVRHSNIGLAAGDERLLRLARQAEQAASQPVALMYHVDIPLGDQRGRLRYGLCGSTLRACYEERGLDLRADPVFSYLGQFDPRDELSEDRLNNVRLNEAALDQLAEQVETYRPDVITVGGDWLDMLLLKRLDELAADGLAAMGNLAGAFGTALVVTIYVGPLVDFVLPETAVAALVPLNESGAAMLPDRVAALGWMAKADRPFIAMHLMSGAASPRAALMRAGVVDGGSVVAAVVGASKPQNIDDLLIAARETWGPA